MRSNEYGEKVTISVYVVYVGVVAANTLLKLKGKKMKLHRQITWARKILNTGV
jgi:hypothetical protein